MVVIHVYVREYSYTIRTYHISLIKHPGVFLLAEFANPARLLLICEVRGHAHIIILSIIHFVRFTPWLLNKAGVYLMPAFIRGNTVHTNIYILYIHVHTLYMYIHIHQSIHLPTHSSSRNNNTKWANLSC